MSNPLSYPNRFSKPSYEELKMAYISLANAARNNLVPLDRKEVDILDRLGYYSDNDSLNQERRP